MLLLGYVFRLRVREPAIHSRSDLYTAESKRIKLFCMSISLFCYHVRMGLEFSCSAANLIVYKHARRSSLALHGSHKETTDVSVL
jgi:hypothetical protein